MSSILALDITTIPDIDAGKKVFQLGELKDDDAAKAMFHLQMQATGSTHLPAAMQQIVTVTGILQRSGKPLEVICFGDALSNNSDCNGAERERAVLSALFSFIDEESCSLIFRNTNESQSLLKTRLLRHVLQMDKSVVRVLNIKKSILNDIARDYSTHSTKPLTDKAMLQLSALVDFPMIKSYALRTRWHKWQDKNYAALQDYSAYKAWLIYALNRVDACIQGRLTQQQLLALTEQVKENLNAK